VTGFFDRRWGFPESLARMAAEANLVRRDGHSDYGAALGEFWDRFAEAVGPRSTVVVTGDARNNYRSDGREYLALIAERSRALFWLNPEARRYWNTGDSIMASYASVCDVVAEVRTLRQLEAFVARAALPAARRVYGAPAVP